MPKKYTEEEIQEEMHQRWLATSFGNDVLVYDMVGFLECKDMREHNERIQE